MPVDVQAVVVANTRLSADYSLLTLEAPEIAAAFKPGQFVMLQPRTGCDPLLRRPFSVFQRLRDKAGRATRFTILNKRVGSGTTILYEAAVDDRIACLGPLGHPFTIAPADEAWMVAGGVGLAPFATLAESLRECGRVMTLFYGGRSITDLFFLDFFDRLGVRLVLTTEDGTRGEQGRVTVPLARQLAARDAARSIMIYACGPEAMLKAVALLAAQHRCSSEVATERTMGCGMGGCYSCVVRVRRDDGSSHFVRSCLAGPVFRGDEIVWD